MPKPGGKLVRASIAARSLGLHVETIRTWIRKKKIDGVRLAGRWYVFRSALEKIQETQSTIEG